jgi:hypothetical protein
MPMRRRVPGTRRRKRAPFDASVHTDALALPTHGSVDADVSARSMCRRISRWSRFGRRLPTRDPAGSSAARSCPSGLCRTAFLRLLIRVLLQIVNTMLTRVATLPMDRWESVVTRLMSGEEEGEGECGLRMDFLAAVNPLLWSHLQTPGAPAAAAGKQGGARMLECVFSLQSGVDGGEVSRRRGNGARSCHAALAAPLLLGSAAGAQSYRFCRQWLLGETMFNPSTGAMHAVRRSDAGDKVLGPELDGSLCLQALSVYFTLESGPLEGTWGEGGGGEVSETRTRRENMGLATGPRAGATATGVAASENECVTMAHYLVSEGARIGGCVAMGRMQLIVLLLRENLPAAVAVSRALHALVARPSSEPPDSRMGCQGPALGLAARIAQAAADVLERLRRALPKLMSSADNALAEGSCGVPGARDVSEGDERAAGTTQQTSRLDRLLHDTLTALQHDDASRAAPALHVARQLAVAQPSLVANRMLLLKGMCAGKVLLSLSDFVERGHHKLLLNVLAVLEAAAPHSLRCRRLPLVLDEYFLLFSSIVRYEAVLEPLLQRLAGLMLRLVPLGGAAADYVRRQVLV